MSSYVFRFAFGVAVIIVLYGPSDVSRSRAQTKQERTEASPDSLRNENEKYQCNVDFNVETVLYADVPYLLHQQAFVPAITEVKYTHDMNLLTYSVPFRRFWQLSGLESFIPWRNASCCDGCSNNCFPTLNFKKAAPGEALCDFSWESCNSRDFTENYRVDDLEFRYTIPKKLSGKAVIGSGLIQFFFRNLEGPHLKITDHNYEQSGRSAVTFDGDVACMSTTANWFIVKQRKPIGSPNIPDLPLFVEAK